MAIRTGEASTVRGRRNVYIWQPVFATLKTPERICPYESRQAADFQPGDSSLCDLPYTCIAYNLRSLCARLFPSQQSGFLVNKKESKRRLASDRSKRIGCELRFQPVQLDYCTSGSNGNDLFSPVTIPVDLRHRFADRQGLFRPE